MTSEDVVLLVLGALLGAIVSAVYNASRVAIDNKVRKMLIARRAKRASTGLVAKGTVDYYVKHGAGDRLYVPTMIAGRAPVAAVGGTTDGFPVEVLRSDGELVRLDPKAEREVLPYDRRLIESQIRRGARIFDGEILYVKDRKWLDDGRLCLVAGRCNFFSYATLTLRLQEEATRFRSSSKYREHLMSLSPHTSARIRPQAIGCSCATVFESDSGPMLAVSNRSSEVVTAASSRATLPSFGMETNAIGGESSEYGLFYHNYVREFAEEFFDLEELVHMMMSRRSDPDWMFQLPQVKMIDDQAKSGGLDLQCMGMACNPHDGALNFIFLGHFRSVDFYRWVRRESRANWESNARTAGNAPIEFVGLFDSKIDEWVAEGHIHGCSVVSVDLARRYLAQTKRGAQ
jgi:hypothetical protein